MPFAAQEYYELVRLLVEHPEWRLELQRLLLPDDYLTLPAAMRELAEAQRRTEERLERLEAVVETLAEAQRRTEEQLRALAEHVYILAEAQHRMVDTLAGFKGRVLELDYREKAGAYFGPLLRRLRVVPPHTLEDELQAQLSPEEFKDVLQLDLLVSGQPRYHPEMPEVWLAVEVSAVIDKEDVSRAQRRAELLRRAGYQAIPAVAGERATLVAEDEARLHNVVMLQDGRVFLWQEALAATSTH